MSREKRPSGSPLDSTILGLRDAAICSEFLWCLATPSGEDITLPFNTAHNRAKLADQSLKSDLSYVGDSGPQGCTEDEGMPPRGRLAEAGPKAPQAVAVKSNGKGRFGPTHIIVVDESLNYHELSPAILTTSNWIPF